MVGIYFTLLPLFHGPVVARRMRGLVGVGEVRASFALCGASLVDY